MRTAVVKIVEDLLRGIKSRDLSQVRFAPDVTLESPLTPRLEGREAVVKFLTKLAPAVIDIRISQHIVEGDYCATLYDWDTLHGTVSVLARYHVVKGELKSIRTFHDLRLLTEVLPARS